MKVRHVLCLPIVLLRLSSCSHVATIIFCKFEKRIKMFHIITTYCLQTFYNCYLLLVAHVEAL